MLTIEDDDGFRTEWPWPDGKSMLANGAFVGVCEGQHEVLRARWWRDRARERRRAG